MVSIIIPHFKNSGNLEKCLESAINQTYNPKELIVINNSGSKSLESYIIKSFPMVKFINPGRNLFYSAAQNLGVKESQGSYILFLNDDVTMEDDFISQLVEGLKQAEEIGMACGKILRLDKTLPLAPSFKRNGKGHPCGLRGAGRSIPVDKITIDSAGQFLGRDRRPIERGWQKKDRGQYNSSSFVFGPGGAASLYRREVLEETAIDGEYFDQDFKIFYEDLDLAWRANKFGWRTFYNPNALAYHQRGASTQTLKPKLKFLREYYFACMDRTLQWQLVKNRYLTMVKSDSIKSFLLNLPYILVYELKLWSYILLFRQKIVLDLIKSRGLFEKALKKRRIFEKNLSITGKKR